MSVNDVNPAILFGGAWERWGVGRVPVGLNTTQSEFSFVEQTGFSESTIKSFFRRENLRNDDKEINKKCKYCGKKLVQTKGHRQKKFCSDKCRFAWWKSQNVDLPEDSPYIFRCKNCGKEFNRCGKKNRKYCSFGCYIVDRFKIKKF